MVDLVLSWVVIVLPIAISIVFVFIPGRQENEKVHMRWRYSLVVLGIAYSFLVWWQQSRANNIAAKDRETAIETTSDRVATRLIRFLSDLPPGLTKEDINSIVKTWAHTILNKPASTRELRQKEYELAKQIRKVGPDHMAALQRIDNFCASQGRNRSAHCGVSQTHEEMMAYEKAWNDYLRQAASLRDEMLAKLPTHSGPEVSIEQLSGEQLADYLDGLALSLP
jgi:hypothetical protein